MGTMGFLGGGHNLRTSLWDWEEELRDRYKEGSWRMCYTSHVCALQAWDGSSNIGSKDKNNHIKPVGCRLRIPRQKHTNMHFWQPELHFVDLRQYAVLGSNSNHI